MIRNLHQKLLLHAGVLLQDLAIPHEKRVRKSTARPYVTSLVTLPLFFLTNYLFNHQRLWLGFLPEGRPMYFFTVLLPFGVLLPSLTLGWIIREADGEAHLFGATIKMRDLKMMLFAFIAGIIINIIPVGRLVIKDPYQLLYSVYLSILLFSSSLAEILLHVGVVFNFMQWLMLKKLPGRNRVLLRTMIAIVVSALTFAAFHLSYPAPWNSWQMMLILLAVGVIVMFFYAITRSIAAAVVFDNILSVAGYMLTGTGFTDSIVLGLVFNGISVFAVILILMLVGIYDEEF